MIERLKELLGEWKQFHPRSWDAMLLRLVRGIEHDEARRISELRFGIERIIEKARYDEYGSFEDVRARIIALAEEILTEDSRRAQ